MQKPTVYLETTVIGHLVGRIHPDPVVANKQHVTRNWWATAAERFTLFASRLVAQECSVGDPVAAAERLEFLTPLTVLNASPEANELTDLLLAGYAVPSSEPRDAAHISLAAVYGIQYLLTWNFKHIANLATRATINLICRNAGYDPPIICTPADLAGVQR